MKNLPCRLACKFDLDQNERKLSQVNGSARLPWPNGVASRPKFSTCVYLRVRLARAEKLKDRRRVLLYNLAIKRCEKILRTLKTLRELFKTVIILCQLSLLLINYSDTLTSKEISVYEV